MTVYAIVRLGTGEVLSVAREKPDERTLRDEIAEAVPFDTVEARERDPRVAAFRLRRWANTTLTGIGPPAMDARSIKANEAQRWLALHPLEDGAVPDAYHWPMLELEYRLRGLSGHEASTAILAAIHRDAVADMGAVAAEEQRIAMKVRAQAKLRSIDAHIDLIPDV